LAQHPKSDRGCLVVGVSISHTVRHTHSSERVINPSKRPLHTQLTTNTTDEYPCLKWDLNPRSHKSSSCRPTLQTVRPKGSAIKPRVRITLFLGQEVCETLSCPKRRDHSTYPCTGQGISVGVHDKKEEKLIT